jgi:hypothetical protein
LNIFAVAAAADEAVNVERLEAGLLVPEQLQLELMLDLRRMSLHTLSWSMLWIPVPLLRRSYQLGASISSPLTLRGLLSHILLDAEVGDMTEDETLEGVEGASGIAGVSSMKTSRVGVRASGRLKSGAVNVVSG